MAKSGAVVQAVGGARPLLKGHHQAYMKKHLTIGLIISCSLVVATKFLLNEPRKAAYAEYYKNYNIEAEFERIRKLGYFQSCPAN